MPVAKDTILLGRLGEIRAGDEVPATYLDDTGAELKTDFARLEELGLVDAPKPKPQSKPHQRRGAAKKD